MNAETRLREALHNFYVNRDGTKEQQAAWMFEDTCTPDNIFELLTELDARQTKIDVLQKDADRLAFICTGLVYLEPDNDTQIAYAVIADKRGEYYKTSTDFLSAIDAAIAESKGGVL